MKAIAIVALTLGGCTAPVGHLSRGPHWLAHADTTFTADEREDLDAVAARIEEQTGGALTVDIVYDGDSPTLLRRSVDDPQPSIYERGMAGYAWKGGAVVILADYFQQDEHALRQAVIMHEFVHHFGVGHLHTGLMRPDNVDVRCIDAPAMAELVRLYDISTWIACGG